MKWHKVRGHSWFFYGQHKIQWEGEREKRREKEVVVNDKPLLKTTHSSSQVKKGVVEL
jgi:hypothetical protein